MSISAITIVALFCAAVIRQKASLKNTKTAELAGQIYLSEMQKLDSLLAEYPSYFMDSSYTLRLEKYTQLAQQLKRVELFFIYLHSETAYKVIWQPVQLTPQKAGPPIPDNFLIAGPFGIDPDSVLAKSDKRSIDFSIMFIKNASEAFRKSINETNYTNDPEKLTDEHVMNALRLQMFRITSVGIGNGDFQLNPVNLPCVSAEIESWSQITRLYINQPPDNSALKSEILNKLDSAEQFMANNKDFDSFDRMAFITGFLNPLSVQLTQLRKALKIAPVNQFSAINPESDNLFDQNAFNGDFFSPEKNGDLTAQRVELGKLLFFDPILSDNNQRACASCHKPEKAFTDGFQKSMSFTMKQLPRNSPTVINSVYQTVQFWDSRVNSLEDQADSVVMNSEELHSSFENVASRIRASDEYVKLFHRAFPETIKNGIGRKQIKSAIATYERTLVGLNSSFDKYMRGDKSALTKNEVNGFNIFMGKGRCGSCHYAPLFNGTLPPYYSMNDHRRLGIPLRDTMSTYTVDPDVGEEHSTRNPLFKFSFKTPTVRNVALTAPYMHNGIYQTLDQVVDFYNHGGGNEFLKDEIIWTILPDHLNLTIPEKKDLVSFLKALTDTTSSANTPKRLPKLGGKYAGLNVRVIGGKY